MKGQALRQLIGGLVGGAVVIALIGSSLVLTTGDLITIPTLGYPTPRPSDHPTIRPPDRPIPDTSTPSNTPTLAPTSTCPRPPGWIDHVVAAGEDLPGIAARYAIDPVVLQVNNCLVAAVVTPNMVLFVPAPPTLPPLVTSTRGATVVARPTVCGPPLGWTIYRVQPGDTLSSIARATRSTVQALMLANCLPSDKIRVGQILYVPRPPIPIVTIPFIPTRTPIPSPSPTGTPTSSATLATIEPTTPVIPTLPSPTETPPGLSPTPSPTIEDPPPTDTPLPTTDPTPTPQPATETPIPSVTPTL